MAERRIGGVIHTFYGTELSSRAEAFSRQSVVDWVDSSTGQTIRTSVACLGGWMPSLFTDDTEVLHDNCIDEVDVNDHARQLPGDV